MARTASGNARAEDPLRAPWPPFLDLMDEDPERAFEGFYVFAAKLLAVCPPGPLRGLRDMDREDLIHDIVLHCARDDFRVLRRYQNRGRSFASWFLLVARNKVLDHLRAKKNAPAVSLAEDDEDNPGVILPDTGPDAERETDSRQVLFRVQEAMQDMSDQCRLLLQGAAEGCRPQELTRLMGWPADWNKKVSDALRECRRGLKRRLLALGVSAEELRVQRAD